MQRFNENFADALVQETLIELAESFFGTRCRLEDMLTVFHSYVEALRKKEETVIGEAGILNNLLIHREIAEKFHHTIGVEKPDVFLDCVGSEGLRFIRRPFAFTAKGVFTRLVIDAYGRLQRTWDEYTTGGIDNVQTSEENGTPMVDYNLVQSMCLLINNEIQKVNSERSPLSILQYVHKLDVQSLAKQELTGGSIFTETEGGFNTGMRYRSIDFESLNLKKFPELPSKDRVVSKITSFCHQFFAGNSHIIKARLGSWARGYVPNQQQTTIKE